MTTQTQYKTRGILLTVSFFVVLFLIFMPLFPGHGKKVNGLHYLDNFFNELSKGSANYIQMERDKVSAYKDKGFNAVLDLKSKPLAALASNLIASNQGNVTVISEGTSVDVKGSDLGGMLSGMLADAEAMYYNKSDALEAKYGANGREVLYTWYTLLSALEKDCTKKSLFAEASLIRGTMSRAIEPAYNYYGIEGKSVKAEMFLLIGALAFYVIYTIWYGFGLLYLFEGFGIKLEH